jgi:hypothetical protein
MSFVMLISTVNSQACCTSIWQLFLKKHFWQIYSFYHLKHRCFYVHCLANIDLLLIIRNIQYIKVGHFGLQSLLNDNPEYIQNILKKGLNYIKIKIVLLNLYYWMLLTGHRKRWRKRSHRGRQNCLSLTTVPRG